MRDLAITQGSGPLLSVSTVAVLCAASAAPFWFGQMEWAPRLVDGMAAGGAVVLASLLAAMVRMVVLDWLAERQIARAWTAIGTGADEPVVNKPAQSDHSYVPVVADPEVLALLRVYRHAVPLRAPAPDGNAGGTDAGVDRPPCAPLSGAAGASNLEHDKGDGAASTPAHRLGLSGSLDIVAPAAPSIRSKLLPRRGVRFAREARRVANGAWPSPHHGLRVLGIPIRIASDIVVVGQGEKGLPPGDQPHQQGNGGITKSFTAAAEARRQVVALAEALARQAAREDDAAEAAEERSRYPPDVSAEQSPPHGAKDDDTS